MCYYKTSIGVGESSIPPFILPSLQYCKALLSCIAFRFSNILFHLLYMYIYIYIYEYSVEMAISYRRVRSQPPPPLADAWTRDPAQHLARRMDRLTTCLEFVKTIEI